MPNQLPPLMACRQSAPPSRLVSAPSRREVAAAGARAVQGTAQQRARLPAGGTRLERHGAPGQAFDPHRLDAGRVRLMRATHDDIIARATQVGVAWQPWRHPPRAPPLQPVVQVAGALRTTRRFPPWGPPAARGSMRPSSSPPAFSHRRIRRTRRGAPPRGCPQRRRQPGAALPKKLRRSAASTPRTGVPARTSGSVARAWCAPTPGRPPTAPGRKSCAEMAVSTSATPRWRPRSPMHGPPSRRSARCPGCGRSGRRPGGGREPWVCPTRRVAALPTAQSCVTSSAVRPSRPGAVWGGTRQRFCHSRAASRCGATLVTRRVGAGRAFAALRSRPVRRTGVFRSVPSGPLPPVVWRSWGPRAGHRLLAASPCHGRSPAPRTRRPSDGPPIIGASARRQRIRPYQRRVHLRALPWAHTVLCTPAGGTAPGRPPAPSPSRRRRSGRPRRGPRGGGCTRVQCRGE